VKINSVLLRHFVVQKTKWLSSACVAAVLLSNVSSAVAEGVVQLGLGQDLVDTDQAVASLYASDVRASSLYVDILAAGEVINVSLCGSENADDLAVRIYAPSDDVNPIFTRGLTSSNVDCANTMTNPLLNPIRYTTLETGTYRLELQNTTRSLFSTSLFKRYDITVTSDENTNPDPTIAAGRLWSYNFVFNGGGFSEDRATDADIYALIPGGRPDTTYVWQLDLNNFAGYGYNLGCGRAELWLQCGKNRQLGIP